MKIHRRIYRYPRRILIQRKILRLIFQVLKAPALLFKRIQHNQSTLTTKSNKIIINNPYKDLLYTRMKEEIIRLEI